MGSNWSKGGCWRALPKGRVMRALKNRGEATSALPHPLTLPYNYGFSDVKCRVGGRQDKPSESLLISGKYIKESDSPRRSFYCSWCRVLAENFELLRQGFKRRKKKKLSCYNEHSVRLCMLCTVWANAYHILFLLFHTLSTAHLRYLPPELYMDKLATTGASLFIVSESYVPMKCCVYIYISLYCKKK